MTWTIDGCISMQNLDIVRGGNRIAMIDCENEALSDSDILTNARLIAAAPDMLAALEDAVEALSEAKYYPSELNRLQAVIAKAKGA
jgi:hypothetical protein